MKFISTNKSDLKASLKEAVLEGMARDGGLYLPEHIPSLDPEFLTHLPNLNFQEIALKITSAFLADDIPAKDLEQIVNESMKIDVKLSKLSDQVSVLETFHGPTMAFKDFGARFMAQLMSYLMRGESQELTILVATSGDTGSAVASGFLGVPGIRVIILYPSGKVSPSQEKQLTTQGQNITALEIDGTFDDCQRMVKAAFADQELRQEHLLSSANSINIARLIPQTFYYAWATGQLMGLGKDIIFSVPCGNFGNITAGLLAKRMGIPISHFIAATNVNAVFPEYLETGEVHARPSLHTMSNAMDVGDPSNLARINCLYNGDLESIRADFHSWSYSDAETQLMIKSTYDTYGYIADPHTAVGLLGMREYQRKQGGDTWQGVVVSTAHPAKFPESVEPIIGSKLEIPSQLAQYLGREKKATQLSTSYAEFRQYLVDTLG